MRNFTYFPVKFLIGITFILTFCFNTFAQNEEWFIVFTTGQSPERTAFFIDGNSIKTSPAGNPTINFVTVSEAKGSPQYISSKLEFRCKTNESKVTEVEGYTFENTTTTGNDSTWVKVNNPIFEHIKSLACNKAIFERAMTASRKSSGMIDNEKINIEIEKAGLGNFPILSMTNELIPDFDQVLNVLWNNFWKAQRPPRTGIAKNKPKKDLPKSTSNESAESLVNKGAEEMRLGYYDKALVYLRQALKADPYYDATYFYFGYIFADVGEFDNALFNYNRAIELNPNNTNAYYNRGLIYFEQKHKFELAEADFTKAIQLDSQEPKFYFRRGDLYESWGKDNLAEADRKKFKSLGGNALQGFQNARRTLFPLAEFDVNIAKNALQQGTSTLIGRACASVKEGQWGLGGSTRFDAANVQVALFPVTPYLEKWYQLREKKEDKKTGVFINQEARKYALVTKTNGKGEFVFSRLKPGKYFVQIIFNFVQHKTSRVYTGSNTSQEGNIILTTNYYEDRDYYIDRNTRLEKFVEITGEGESKKVTVMNRFSLFGCKDVP